MKKKQFSSEFSVDKQLDHQWTRTATPSWIYCILQTLIVIFVFFWADADEMCINGELLRISMVGRQEIFDSYVDWGLNFPINEMHIYVNENNAGLLHRHRPKQSYPICLSSEAGIINPSWHNPLCDSDTAWLWFHNFYMIIFKTRLSVPNSRSSPVWKIIQNAQTFVFLWELTLLFCP